MHKFLRDQDGASTVLAILWFLIFCAIGGLAVDITNGFRVRAQMQAAADAAAHAAVIDLPDETAAVDTALEYAEYTMPAAIHGTVLAADDVQIGVWDKNNRTFTEGATPPNAVRVTLRRSSIAGNPVPTSLLRITGLRSWNVEVASTASYGGNDKTCLNNGFLSEGKAFSGSENTYIDDLCIYGRLGVKVGSTNYFEEGVQVMMPDLELLEDSQDNEGLHPSCETCEDGALYETPLEVPLPGQVDSIVQDLMVGDISMPGSLYYPNVVPPYQDRDTGEPIPPMSEQPETWEPNTLYRIDGVVDFGSGSSDNHLVIDNIGVISNSEIKVGSAVDLSNVLLATPDKVTLGSENNVGNSYCTSNDNEVFIFAGGEFSAGSQTYYSGVQVVGAEIVKLGSELVSVEGISVQAGGDLFWGSADKYGGCGAPSFFGAPGVGRVALVD